VDSRRFAKGAELSTAAVVACDEPTDAVGNSGRTRDFILCSFGNLGQQVVVGIRGVQLQPLVDALKIGILSHSVLHADETPVEMLKPGNKKTHRAYLWAYAPGAFEDLKAVVCDFCESRAGEHARAFLGEW
jgi:hypothetical protein